ncbi:hypothetical protein N1851_034055 [Merluccius polli]|uniref:Uncharacterized protein n=1 Tax=Merluccius polli TaxID=89951 RepID=A0AA47M078_MERPO|nr:hypothetical protein N1851_034055 [Merluccius polli]
MEPEGNCNSSEPGSSSKGRRKWTEEEVQAVEKMLKTFIISRKVPGKQDCERCIESSPQALQYRDWKAQATCSAVTVGKVSVELQTTSEHRDIGSDGSSFPPDGSSPQLTSSPAISPFGVKQPVCFKASTNPSYIQACIDALKGYPGLFSIS